MRAVAHWCHRHRLLVLAAWLVAVLAANVAVRGAGTDYQDDFILPQTQSAQATRLLQASVPHDAGDVDRLVIAVRHGRVTAPAVRARAQHLISQIAALPHVTQVASPYPIASAAATAASRTPGGAGPRAPNQISRSGQVAFATITFDESAGDLPGRETSAYDHMIMAASGHGVSFAGSGQVAEDGNPSGPSSSLPIGFIAAGLVLLIVFGTLAATLLPLLVAGASLGTGLAVVGLISHVFAIASFSTQLATLIGLGVGVDYALFIVTRYRQGMLRGLGSEHAIAGALDTSGRAVLFAGAIVCVAMLGMMLLGVEFLFGVAIAAAVTVAFTVMSSLTLLPALLSLFGSRTMRRRDRRAIQAGRLRTTDESAAWRRWAGVLSARPALLATLAVAVMALLTVPFFSMRLGAADAGSDAHSTTTYRAYTALARGFGPGYSGPLELVARAGSSTQRSAFVRVAGAVRQSPGVSRVTAPVFLAGTAGRPTIAEATVYPAGSPDSASTASLLQRLRNTVIPRAEQGSGLAALVGGQTATLADFAGVLSAKLPLFVGIVVLVSALLLVLVFRSLLVPLAAALMNLLSTAASLGVVTAVFQWSGLAKLVGVPPGPIEAFVPVLMFPILFGLSMDYEVFLVSRICEEWHARGDNREAVRHGLAATGKTITTAAAIMVLVFAAFVMGGQRIIELFGVGLASAVLLDAAIVRAVMVPTLMLLLGRANWHMPAWLERWLPHLRVEGHAARAPLPDVAG